MWVNLEDETRKVETPGESGLILLGFRLSGQAWNTDRETGGSG